MPSTVRWPNLEKSNVGSILHSRKWKNDDPNFGNVDPMEYLNLYSTAGLPLGKLKTQIRIPVMLLDNSSSQRGRMKRYATNHHPVN